MSEKQKLLLLGCGDLPSRLMQKIDLHTWQVAGLRRSNLPLKGVEMSLGNACDAAAVEPLLQAQPQQIILCLTPDSRESSAYRDSYLSAARTLSKLCREISPSSHLIFVSSTSVYGQNSGEEIDENSETNPKREQSRVLLEAEKEITQGANPWSIVRFSGIYGPGRTRLLENVRAGKFTPDSSTSWTNRIHAEDCAAVLKQVLDNFSESKRGLEYLIGSDCEPALNTEVESWLAERLKVSSPIPRAELNKSIIRGKRCKNSKLLGLGFEFLYPGFREGYQALTDASRNEKTS